MDFIHNTNNEVNILTLTIFVSSYPNCLKTFDKSFLRLLGMRNNLQVTLCMNRYGLLKNAYWSSVLDTYGLFKKMGNGPLYVLLSMYGLIFSNLLHQRMS